MGASSLAGVKSDGKSVTLPFDVAVIIRASTTKMGILTLVVLTQFWPNFFQNLVAEREHGNQLVSTRLKAQKTAIKTSYLHTNEAY